MAHIEVELASLGLDRRQGGLPAWTAPVALGDPPPRYLPELPEELIEDLRQLGREARLPAIKAPRTRLRSRGNLSATGAENFEIIDELSDPDTDRPVQEEGIFWRDPEGRYWMMPTRLREALQQVRRGPPPPDKTRTPYENTRARRLWWGELRPSLLEMGVSLDRYLENQEIVLVDRIKPRLTPGRGSGVEVRVEAPGVSEEDLTQAADRIDPRRPQDPTLRTRDDRGNRRIRRLLLTSRGARALSTTHRLRQSRGRFDAQLVDAPETLFDPELFDLSEYSDRVLGLGPVVYRVSRFEPGDGSETLRLRLLPAAGSGALDQGDLLSELDLEERQELADLLQRASQQGASYVQYKGRWIRVPSQRLADGLSHQTRSETTATARELEVALNLDELTYVPDDEGGGTVVGLPERPPGLLPGVDLYEYQRAGMSWLAGHAAICPEASDHGLLADDMGLGKTLQVLCLMSILRRFDLLSPCLLVAPSSLLENWTAEADRFFPGVFGDRSVLRGGGGTDIHALRRSDWVLVSYETLRSRQVDLGRITWKLMVADESHRIRNPTAQTTRALLAMDAERRLALSGTPLQNSLVDLWSQFDWLAPGYLGDLKGYRRRWISRSRKDSAERAPLGDLRARIAPRVLRRTKRRELKDELPPIQVHRSHLDYSPSQASLYEVVLADARRGGRGAVLGVLHRLFRLGADPEHVGLDPDGSHPKLEWLLELLDGIRDRGEKAIVFAEWYSVQDLLVRSLESRYGIHVDRLNGKVDARDRLGKVMRFNERKGFDVMVLGPKATGVGLNITGANHVVHFTRHWNPARENQATDRAYRIGQKRPVHVYLPIMVHPHRTSVEEHLDRLLKQKESLAADVVVPTEELTVEVEMQKSIFEEDEPHVEE